MARTASTAGTETERTPRKRAARSEDGTGAPKRKAAPKKSDGEAVEKPRRGPREMSAEHKSALADGRRESAAVRAYLDAWELHRPKRGRKRTPESIQNRIAAIDEQLTSASAFERLHLTQERLNLENEIATMETGVDLSALEDGFVEVAAAYGRRRGITYNSWRQIGLSPELLKRAGISRSS